MTKQEVISLIQETVYEITDVKIESDEISLLDSSLGINPSDFLYIFDCLEEKLNVPVSNILKGSRYNVMVIDNFSDAVLKMLLAQ